MFRLICSYSTTRSTLERLQESLSIGDRVKGPGWFQAGEDTILVVKESDPRNKAMGIWHALVWIKYDPREDFKLVCNLPYHRG